MKFDGLDVPSFFAADLVACDMAELALPVGVAGHAGLERVRLITHSIVHDVGAAAPELPRRRIQLFENGKIARKNSSNSSSEQPPQTQLLASSTSCASKMAFR